MPARTVAGSTQPKSKSPVEELAFLAAAEPAKPCLYWRRGQEVLTYAEVRDRIQRAASSLQNTLENTTADSAIPPKEGECRQDGNVIGLHFGCEPEVVIALQAVWASGYTVAVLNMSWSAQVLQTVVAKLRIRHIICGRASALKHSVGVESMCIADLVERGNAAVYEQRNMPDTALVMHTSGSTGVPKSIAIPTRSVLLSDPVVTAAPADPARAILIRGLPTFLSRVKRIIGFPYLKSALLFHPEPCLPEEHLEDYNTLLHDGLADNVYFPPSLMRGFAEAYPDRTWDHISFIGLTGEKVLPEAASLARRLFPNATISACYCGTETYGCNAVCCFSCTEDVPTTISYDPASPFGHGNDAFLIDAVSGAIVPQEPGNTGIIHFAGPSLAAGYIGDDEGSARTFVTLPNGRQAVNLCDIGEWSLCGQKLIVHGRADRRVKINGIYVDLDFIDTALMKDSAVGNVVTVKTQSDRLVAFHDGNVPDAIARFRHLLAQAAGSDYDGHGKHVTVHAATWLPYLPKNASGKTHLARLQELAEDGDDCSSVDAPVIDRAVDKDAYRVSEICARILNVPNLAGTDFRMVDVGMDSVRAMRASLLIKRELGLFIGALTFLGTDATPSRLVLSCSGKNDTLVPLSRQMPSEYELPTWSLTCFGYTYRGDFDFPLPAILRPPCFHLLIDLTKLLHLDTRRTILLSEKPIDLDRLRAALTVLGQIHPVLRTVPRPTSIPFFSAYSTIASIAQTYVFDIKVIDCGSFLDDKCVKEELEIMIRRGAMIAILANPANGFIQIAFNHGPCTGTSMSTFRRHLRQIYEEGPDKCRIPIHLPVDRASLWAVTKHIYPMLPGGKQLYRYPTYHRPMWKLGRCLEIEYDVFSISSSVPAGEETAAIPLFVMAVARAFNDALPISSRLEKMGSVHLLDAPVPGRTGNSCLWSYSEIELPAADAAPTAQEITRIYDKRETWLVPDQYIDGGTPDILLFNIKSWDDECGYGHRHLEPLRVQLTQAILVELWLHDGRGLVEATLTVRQRGELAYGAAGGNKTVQAIARNLRQSGLAVSLAGL